MGKGTDKLYITHSEWASSDSFSANSGARLKGSEATFKSLPFNFCSASLQPFKNPVCTPDGTIFDEDVINSWLARHRTNPVDGKPLESKDLIRLNFVRNVESQGEENRQMGDLIDPVTYKVFTDNTHIVAVRHGTYANVFAWDTVERMNIKAKLWRDLLDDAEFCRGDIITLQDPQNVAGRDTNGFKHHQDDDRKAAGGVNIGAQVRTGEKVLKAREAVEKARRERHAGSDVNRSSGAAARPLDKPGSAAATQHRSMAAGRERASQAASYTTGKAAASFTSTGLTPETSGERALLSTEEWMLKPKRVKNQGYARIETNHGELTVELHADTAPKAVWNFVKLAQKGYYRGTTFHRNIRNFMIQGGDPSGTGKGGMSIWGKSFEDELDGPRTHSARGILSMANKGKNTNSSQFFITYRAAKHLDRVHTIFGRVVDGMGVLGRLEEMPTDGSDRPLNKIVVEDVVVFVDPFEEFLREKNRREEAEAHKAEIRRLGGDDDDRVTWTGKRIRETATEATTGGADGVCEVGKYLRLEVGVSLQRGGQRQRQSSVDAKAGKNNDDNYYATGLEGGDVDDTAGLYNWESQPVRKKAKTGGFGNFDTW